METKKKFDDYERVEKAAKELIRAVMWEDMDFAGGEKEDVLEEAINECMEKYGYLLIEHASLMCQMSYTHKYIREYL